MLKLHYQEQYANNKNIIILTYQIIRNFTDEFILNNYNRVKLIIADECHHLSGKKWCTEFLRLEKLTKGKVLGLTATPETFVNEDIVNTFFKGTQVQPFNLIDGLYSKFIPTIKYVVAYSDLKDKQNIIDNRMSEIDRYKISNLLNVEKILTKHIPSDYLEQNLKILVFVSRIKYIQEAYDNCFNWFRKIYKNKTINIFILNSYNTNHFNQEQLTKFKQQKDKNNIDIMISVDKLIEGLHLPEVRVAIMFRKTRSKRVYFQQMGRVTGIRTSLIFDLINNSSYLYAMSLSKNNKLSNEVYNRDKIMYEGLIELIDETKDIELILSKYDLSRYKQNYIDVISNYKEQIEFQSTKMSYNQLFKYLGIDCRIGVFNRICDLLCIHFIPKQEHQRLIALDNWTKFKDEIIENKDGLSIKDLAKKYGFNASYLSHFLTRNNIKVNNLPYNREILVKKYFDNINYIRDNPDHLSKSQLAGKIGVPENFFYSITKRYNIPIKNSNSSDIYKYQNEKTLIDANIEEIKIQLSNKTLNEIANEYNMPSGVFSYYVRKKYGLHIRKSYNLDIDYIINNPDNLTLIELAEKFNYNKDSWHAFKNRLIREGINKIRYKNSFIELDYKLDDGLRKLLESKKEYIIEELKYKSKAQLAKEFGVEVTQFKMGLIVLQFPKSRGSSKITELGLFINQQLEFIESNCSNYTKNAMATELRKISKFKYSRSGIVGQLSKLPFTFKSK